MSIPDSIAILTTAATEHDHEIRDSGDNRCVVYHTKPTAVGIQLETRGGVDQVSGELQ